jgi:DNA repair exonuclease SbcCD ATPase subunit
MEIVLKSLHLVNFKGARDVELTFSPGTSQVRGENGTGKTTIFDAFTWLLFGKDSTQRSDSNFNIKTLDAQGNPILKQEHSVTAVLLVDGKEMKLKRMYREKWEKPTGTTTETLKNHETLFYVNDVKLPTKREYDAKISSIIPENVFRMITNPFFFNSMAAEDKKVMLQDMVGNVTDQDVAQLKPEYAEFLAELAGTPIAEKAKEIKAKKSACNEELALIPTKIETAKKLKPEAEDWDALEKELAEKKAKLAELEALLRNDRSAQNAQIFEQRNSLQTQINDKQLEESKRKNALRLEADKSYNQAVQEAESSAAKQRNEIQAKINDLQVMLTKRAGEVKLNAGKGYEDAKKLVADLEGKIRQLQETLKRLQASKDVLEDDIMEAQKNVSDTERNINETEVMLMDCRNDYKALSASQFVMQPDQMICPTCKRPLDVDDIEAKRQELEANFNAEKAEKVKANVEKGKSVKAKLENLQATLDRQRKNMTDKEAKHKQTESDITNTKNEIKVLTNDLVSARANVPAEPDYKKALDGDAEYIHLSQEIERQKKDQESITAAKVDQPDYLEIETKDQVLIGIKNEITELQNKLGAIKEPDGDAQADNSEAKAEKVKISGEIDAINQRLGHRSILERADKEIKELEDQRDNLNEKVAELEKWEFDCLQFQKAKDDELLRRINGLFQIVSFSFVSSQLNGGEKLTCVCTVNGTPYPDVNNAGKINAGLDIINAICKSKGVNAPIFVDNAESVNNVLETSSQKILLCVTTDKKLLIV